jgi:hypothetical protein
MMNDLKLLLLVVITTAGIWIAALSAADLAIDGFMWPQFLWLLFGILLMASALYLLIYTNWIGDTCIGIVNPFKKD